MAVSPRSEANGTLEQLSELLGSESAAEMSLGLINALRPVMRSGHLGLLKEKEREIERERERERAWEDQRKSYHVRNAAPTVNNSRGFWPSFYSVSLFPLYLLFFHLLLSLSRCVSKLLHPLLASVL